MKALTTEMKRKIERDEKHIKEIIGDREIFKRFWGADIESILDQMNNMNFQKKFIATKFQRNFV